MDWARLRLAARCRRWFPQLDRAGFRRARSLPWPLPLPCLQRSERLTIRRICRSACAAPREYRRPATHTSKHSSLAGWEKDLEAWRNRLLEIFRQACESLRYSRSVGISLRWIPQFSAVRDRGLVRSACGEGRTTPVG